MPLSWLQSPLFSLACSCSCWNGWNDVNHSAGKYHGAPGFVQILLITIAFLDGMMRHEFALSGPPALVLGGLNLFTVLFGIFRKTIWVTTLEAAAIWSAWVFGWTGAHGGWDQSVPVVVFSVLAVSCVVVSGLLVAFVKHGQTSSDR